MNTKFLLITAVLFFFSWRKVADDFLLFCALFAAALSICVFIYRMENVHHMADDEND
ncbi:hypothetical protein [Desulfosarcina variabilis]|jgi:Flp pilus assembly protein protease CpaA|uniref:hypothetical protein n=1 Tax=Desulfosarcina variabilis TaxID=2300 RepID=UPI003AFAEFDF